MPSGRIIEQQAGRLVAHILDADLEPHDIEGRQGAHDYDLILPGGERAALEVTSVVDAVLMTLDHEMARQGHVVPAPSQRRHWDLYLAEDAYPPPIGKSYAALKHRVEAHAPTVLADLEAQGIRYFQLEEWGMQPPQAEALAGLGIEFGGCSSQPVADASITLLPPGGGGPIGPSWHMILDGYCPASSNSSASWSRPRRPRARSSPRCRPRRPAVRVPRKCLEGCQHVSYGEGEEPSRIRVNIVRFAPGALCSKRTVGRSAGHG
jgi:hypothetical protein